MRPDDDAGWTTEEELIALTSWAIEQRPLMTAIEVGTWKGRSAEAIAKGMPDRAVLYCVDSFIGDPHQPTQWRWFPQATSPEGIEEVKLAWQERMAPYSAKLHEATSPDCAIDFPDGQFDFIFVDGCHTYGEVKSDLFAWFPKLRQGGTFCGHDWDQPGVIKALKDLFPFQVEYGPHKLWRLRK